MLTDWIRPLLNFTSQHGRRAHAVNGRAHVELRALSAGEHEALRTRLAADLCLREGVLRVDVNAVVGRVIVAFDEARCELHDIVRIVDRAERDLGLDAAPFPLERPEHPGDLEPLVRCAIELGGDAVGLGMAVVGKLVRLPTLPIELDAMAVLSLFDAPRLRTAAESYLGRQTTAFALTMANAITQGLAQSTVGLAVDLSYHGLVFGERLARRRAWAEREAELCADRPDVAPLAGVESRPAPLPDGPIERYADAAVLAAGGAFAVAVGLTGSVVAATGPLLSGIPKPARLGREAFASALALVLARRGANAVLRIRPYDRRSRTAISSTARSSARCGESRSSFAARLSGGCACIEPHRLQVLRQDAEDVPGFAVDTARAPQNPLDLAEHREDRALGFGVVAQRDARAHASDQIGSVGLLDRPAGPSRLEPEPAERRRELRLEVAGLLFGEPVAKLLEHRHDGPLGALLVAREAPGDIGEHRRVVHRVPPGMVATAASYASVMAARRRTASAAKSAPTVSMEPNSEERANAQVRPAVVASRSVRLPPLPHSHRREGMLGRAGTSAWQQNCDVGRQAGHAMGSSIRLVHDEVMRAMVLDAPRTPLRIDRRDVPMPADGQVLLRTEACAVCRTDLHVVDGELPRPALPLVPGHEIVGTVLAVGRGVDTVAPGAVVGVPWLGWTCGECGFCRSGRENLCPRARFTGYDLDGGYADHVVADHRYCFPIPGDYTAVHAAPLLCAGLIGHRSLRMAGDPRRLGIYGFGAAAHIVAQVARWEGRALYAFVRPGDRAAKDFARSLGAVWAGDATEAPPEPLDAAIIFAPAGELVPAALRAVQPGGTVVCGGIHMSDVPSFPYALLWGERTVRSVANLTRADATEFLALAPRVPVTTAIERYPLEDANRALDDLRAGRVHGAAVLVP